MILGLLLGLGHRCLQLLHSSCEDNINAIDEFHDVFLSHCTVYKHIRNINKILHKMHAEIH